MKVTTLLGLMGVILIVMVSGAVGYVTIIQDGGDGTNNDIEQIQKACQGVKDVACSQGSVSQSDYPDNCIIDGDHILDNPYTCSGQ